MRSLLVATFFLPVMLPKSEGVSVILPYSNPAVPELEKLWRSWESTLQVATNESDACTLSKDEDAAFSVIRIFFKSIILGPGMTLPEETFDHITERGLGSLFIFFMRKTKGIHSTFFSGTYCDDQNSDYRKYIITKRSLDGTNNFVPFLLKYSPRPLVCWNRKCVRCNESEVISTPTCQLFEKGLPYESHPSTNESNLSSSRFSNWTSVLAMTPAEFEATEKTNSDLEEGHYIVKHLLEVWKEWAGRRQAADPCKVGDDEQLSLATMETLLEMEKEDAKNVAGVLARNFVFFLRQMNKLKEEDLPFFCGKGQVCLKEKCVACAEITFNTTNDDQKEVRHDTSHGQSDELSFPSNLYLACQLTNPGEKDRPVLDPHPSTTTERITTESAATSKYKQGINFVSLGVPFIIYCIFQIQTF